MKNGKKTPAKRSFTLIELLIIIVVIGVLSGAVIVASRMITDRTYATRTLAEMKSIDYALNFYSVSHGNNYPCDVSRDLPPGLESYLSSSPTWPKAPWPGAVYDWDYWSPHPENTGCKNPAEAPSCQPSGYCSGQLSAFPNFDIVLQISVRFCDAQGNNCNYPNQMWANDFDMYSSAYWCVYGSCRAHGNLPYNHPGCCLGGNCPADQPKCPL